MLDKGNNFTYDTDVGGFGGENRMSIDQRGFKHFIQAEAADFLQPNQYMLNSTVKTISYSSNGVNVTLTSGEVLEADYVLCTFSLGVLQHDDVAFEPPLPEWKQEAIQRWSWYVTQPLSVRDQGYTLTYAQATYTKIFLQFPEKFWFDTQVWRSWF